MNRCPTAFQKVRTFFGESPYLFCGEKASLDGGTGLPYCGGILCLFFFGGAGGFPYRDGVCRASVGMLKSQGSGFFVAALRICDGCPTKKTSLPSRFCDSLEQNNWGGACGDLFAAWGGEFLTGGGKKRAGRETCSWVRDKSATGEKECGRRGEVWKVRSPDKMLWAYLRRGMSGSLPPLMSFIPPRAESMPVASIGR